MSSHHIVREKQEPALYIHEFGAFNEEYLGQLLEWSPTLLVAGSQYEKAISLGLKVDLVVGNDDHLLFQENTKLIFAPEEQISTVVKHLISAEYPAVNIISTENSFDELQSFLSHIDMVLFTPTEKSYPVKSGFSVWKPSGTVFKLPTNITFTTSNLVQKNEDFVVVKDGFVSFNFNANYLFLTEFL